MTSLDIKSGEAPRESALSARECAIQEARGDEEQLKYEIEVQRKSVALLNEFFETPLPLPEGMLTAV